MSIAANWKDELIEAKNAILQSTTDRERRETSNSFRSKLAAFVVNLGDHVEVLVALADYDDKPLDGLDCDHLIEQVNLNIP